MPLGAAQAASVEERMRSERKKESGGNLYSTGSTPRDFEQFARNRENHRDPPPGEGMPGPYNLRRHESRRRKEPMADESESLKSSRSPSSDKS